MLLRCDSPPCLRPQVVEVHGDFDAAIALDHEEAYRSVVCLRRLKHPE